MDHETKRRLIEILRERSYREGKFKLASGKESPFYVNTKTTALHPLGAELIGKLAVQILVAADLPVEGVGGMTLGADPLATAISLVARGDGFTWPAFIVRKEPKGHGTQQYIEGADNLKPGASVVILEDTTTTGGSALQAYDRVAEAGFKPVAILTVVDREEGGAEAIGARNIPFLSLVKLTELRGS